MGRPNLDPADVSALTEQVKAYAHSVGFDLVAVTSAASFPDAEAILLDRIDRGLMDGLAWFTRERARLATDPRRHVSSALAVLALGMSYLTGAPGELDAQRLSEEPIPPPRPPSGRGRGWGPPPLRGRVARYAWGRDYHEVVEAKLRQVADFLRQLGGGQAKVFVDHGRMVDRAVAQRAGLGWFGKNTNILTRAHGSWVFLAEIVTDLPLLADRQLRTNCGRCTACIPACPTGALVDEYTLDNARCISYLTIELRGSIPRHLRPLVGTWIFGCDCCQDVCPVNFRVQPADHPEYSAAAGLGPSPELLPLLEIGDDEFRARFHQTPIWRARRRGLLRNVAVALGNLGDPAAEPVLSRALGDPEPLVRGHAAWALGRIGGPAAAAALRAALAGEADEEVRSEIAAALGALTAQSMDSA